MDTEAEMLTGKEIYELHQEYTWGELVGRTGLSLNELRYRDRKYRLRAGIVTRQGRLAGTELAIESETPGIPTLLDRWQEYVGRLERRPEWRELCEHAAKAAKIHEAYRPDIRKATRRIITDRPVFDVHMADFHLGSPHAEHEAFIATTDLLLSDPRFYISVVGPDLETAFAWFRSAEVVLNQVLPPWLQIELYRQWLEEIFPRVLAVCGDNHTDERLERMLGDIDLVWRDDLPYFRAWGILKIEVGLPDNWDGKKWIGPFQTYEKVMAHRYKGSSIYHDFQPALRMMRDIYPLADVYVTAHTHQPAYMNGVFYDEARPLKPRQHFVVCGSFKTNGDLYSLRNFGGSGVLGLPTMALWPDEWKVQFFDSPEKALEVMG